MTIRREDGTPEPVERFGGLRELRRARRSGHVASGTLACPSCDAPVFPGPLPLSPADPLVCPVCLHAAAVRDFLSLAAPSRPARVVVRIAEPSRAGNHQITW